MACIAGKRVVGKLADRCIGLERMFKCLKAVAIT